MLEAPTHMLSSLGVGADTRPIDQNVWSMRELLTGSASAIAQVADIDAKRLPLAEQLSMKLASLKRMTAMIGMYLDPDWRLRLLSGNDQVRWVISRTIDEERESGAGVVLFHRIPEVIAPYDPEPLFTDGHKILA